MNLTSIFLARPAALLPLYRILYASMLPTHLPGLCSRATQCLMCCFCLQDSVAVLKKFMANANTIKFNLIALAKAEQ